MKHPTLRGSLPLIVFLLITLVLFRGLHLSPEKIPSPLINQPAPDFLLPELTHPQHQFSQTIFPGHITLLNIWASWCSACQAEHPFLMQIANDPRFKLVGLDYRDESDTASEWLKRAGNPYQIVLADPSGKTGIDWGVYGTPETFVIDKQGRIRYRQIGAMNAATWQRVLLPLVTQLEKEK